MRKIYLLAFSFLIFLLSFSFCSVKANAVENLSASSSPKLENEINYELPYPGLLPDNPLYFLRVIRDRTVGFLIADPLKKSEFDLLQADKRLNAGIFLLKKNKASLSLSTISKAENYFSEAIDKMKEAKTHRINAEEMERKLINSLAKHKQELKLLLKNMDANSKTGFEIELKRVENFEGRLSK
jgi:hypothetical protein